VHSFNLGVQKTKKYQTVKKRISGVSTACTYTTPSCLCVSKKKKPETWFTKKRWKKNFFKISPSIDNFWKVTYFWKEALIWIFLVVFVIFRGFWIYSFVYLLNKAHLSKISSFICLFIWDFWFSLDLFYVCSCIDLLVLCFVSFWWTSSSWEKVFVCCFLQGMFM
jgi:hypothetical protein